MAIMQISAIGEFTLQQLKLLACKQAIARYIVGEGSTFGEKEHRKVHVEQFITILML